MFCPPPDLINNQEYDIIEKNTKRRRQLPRESDQSRPDILICPPEECEAFLREHSDQGCADAGLEVAGGKHPFDEGIDPHRFENGMAGKRRLTNLPAFIGCWHWKVP